MLYLNYRNLLIGIMTQEVNVDQVDCLDCYVGHFSLWKKQKTNNIRTVPRSQ